MSPGDPQGGLGSAPRVATSSPRQRRAAAAPRAPAEGDPELLDRVVALLRERAGVDLAGYRRATLARRVANRMISAGAPTSAEYLRRLGEDPEEPARLLERVTIKVSRFFRNAAAAGAVARALSAERARAPRPLAAWSAGCGRGEEAYTIAILLAELGQPADPPVLATDLDPAALADAARGTYGPAAVAELPAPLRDRWLVAAEPGGGALAVAPALRERVTFRRHDLASGGAPVPGALDLVACRNTLIYFDPPLQQRVLATLCDALRPGGLLWLGEAEWPAGAAAVRLAPVDRAARLFRLREGSARA